MNNPFQAALDKASRKVVLLTAVQTPESDVEVAAEELTDEEIERLGAWACREVIHSGVSSALTLGGMCYLVHAATDRKEHAALYQEFLAEIGVDPRRASDAMIVFRTFGRELLQEPELMPRFPVRTLRNLAAARVPQAVRDEALQRARRGERITLIKALALLQEHGVVEAPKPETTSQDDDAYDDNQSSTTALTEEPSGDAPDETAHAAAARPHRASRAGRQLWASTGDDNVMVVVRTGRESAIPNTSILAALEEATAQFRRYCEMESIEDDRTFGQEGMSDV